MLILPDGSAVNLSRLPEPIIRRTKDGRFLPQPVADAGRTERAVRNDQASKTIRHMPAGRKIAGILGEPPQDAEEQDELPITVPWSEMENWPGQKFALGAQADGRMVQLDYRAAAPHLLMAGTTGSGKTRMGLRPIVSEALALGWNVLILDRSGVDFELFGEYPRCKIVRLDEPEAVTAYMLAVYDQLQKRLRTLNAAGASTWDRMPNAGPYLLVVIDEFASLSETLKLDNPKLRDEFWTATRRVAAEGRKAGVLLALALQNPSRENMDLSLRRLCTRIAFRVQDRDASQIVLGASGAEQLGEGHFMTVLDGLVTGAAFHPSDEEITTFLLRRGTQLLPAPDWGWVGRRPEPRVIEAGSSTLATEVEQLAKKIRRVWLADGSKRAMAREAGVTYGGSWAAKIDQAIDYLEAQDATTPADSPPSGAGEE